MGENITTDPVVIRERNYRALVDAARFGGRHDVTHRNAMGFDILSVGVRVWAFDGQVVVLGNVQRMHQTIMFADVREVVAL